MALFFKNLVQQLVHHHIIIVWHSKENIFLMWSWWDLSNTCGPGSVCLQPFITNSDILKEKSCESQAKYLFIVAKPWPAVLTDPDTVTDKTYCTVGEAYLTLKEPDNFAFEMWNVSKHIFLIPYLYLQWWLMIQTLQIFLCQT